MSFPWHMVRRLNRNYSVPPYNWVWTLRPRLLEKGWNILYAIYGALAHNWPIDRKNLGLPAMTFGSKVRGILDPYAACHIQIRNGFIRPKVYKTCQAQTNALTILLNITMMRCASIHGVHAPSKQSTIRLDLSWSHQIQSSPSGINTEYPTNDRRSTNNIKARQQVVSI